MFLPSNLISKLYEALDEDSLTAFAQTCKTCRALAEEPHLWRRLCILAWTSDLSEFGDVLSGGLPMYPRPVKSWHWLCRKGRQVMRNWSFPASSFLSEEASSELAQFCFNAFRVPELPIPTLKREADAYDSVVQEFLANSSAQDCSTIFADPQIALIVDEVEARAQDLYSELSSSEGRLQLGCMRWGVSLERRAKVPMLVHLYSAFASTVKFYCRLHLNFLQESRDSLTLLSEYCCRWMAFSSAAQQLQNEFRRVGDLLNEMYEAKYPKAGPQFSLMRLMVVLWRKLVFDALEPLLLSAVLTLLQDIRAAPKCLFTDPKCTLLSRAVVSFLDFSLQEINVHYREHTAIALRTPYSLLETALLCDCQHFVCSLNTELPQVSKQLDTDLALLQRQFPPSTLRKVELLYHAHELDMWKVHITKRFREPWGESVSRLRPDVVDQLMNSEFGAFVFSLQTEFDAKSITLRFIERMLDESAGSLACIQRFNALTESVTSGLKPNPNDEDLEYRMKRAKRPTLADANSENRLFALTTDLTQGDVLEILGDLAT